MIDGAGNPDCQCVPSTRNYASCPNCKAKLNRDREDRELYKCPECHRIFSIKQTGCCCPKCEEREKDIEELRSILKKDDKYVRSFVEGIIDDSIIHDISGCGCIGGTSVKRMLLMKKHIDERINNEKTDGVCQ